MKGRVFVLRKLIYKSSAIAACLLCLAISSCKYQTSEQSPPTVAREITDDLGRKVHLPEKIDRAVSLAPNLTEIVFAVDAGDRLVGDTTFCNYPPAAEKVQKIGDTMNPNLESILALKPQVVFVSTASHVESFTRQLEAQNIAVFVTNPKDVESVYRSIYQIGEIMGKNEKAAEVVSGLKERVRHVEAKLESAKDVKVFVQISKEPLFTVGHGSFLNDLINRAGGISATANIEQAYPKFSKESALALDPEAVILSDSPDNLEPNEAFKNSPAMKKGQVFKVNADILSRPGPRMVDALEQIAKSLHPESFE